MATASNLNNAPFEFFNNGILSQFYPSKFVDHKNNVTYFSAEQYMHSQKAKLFDDNDTYRLIMNEKKNPKLIKRYGRLVKNFDQSQWNKRKEDIVFRGNYLKFRQNKHLKDALLLTKGKRLVEAREDSIWGIGLRITDHRIYDETKWKGLNLLGQILDKVRDKLSEE